MHFDYAQEQKMLAESVQRMLESLPRDKDLLKAGTATSALPHLPTFAKSIGDLGLLGIMTSDQHGGLGLGLVEASVAAVETGRNATPFPVIDGIAALTSLATADPDAAADVIAGEAIATAAVGGKLRARGPGATSPSKAHCLCRSRSMRAGSSHRSRDGRTTSMRR